MVGGSMPPSRRPTTSHAAVVGSASSDTWGFGDVSLLERPVTAVTEDVREAARLRGELASLQNALQHTQAALASKSLPDLLTGGWPSQSQRELIMARMTLTERRAAVAKMREAEIRLLSRQQAQVGQGRVRAPRVEMIQRHQEMRFWRSRRHQQAGVGSDRSRNEKETEE